MSRASPRSTSNYIIDFKVDHGICLTPCYMLEYLAGFSFMTLKQTKAVHKLIFSRLYLAEKKR